jgi:lysophospholipase L1-like esterase
MYKNILWYVIIVIALISLVFFVRGFYKAMLFTIGSVNSADMQSPEFKESQVEEIKNENNHRVLIIGDSIAKGTGDEKVKGIGGYLPELLKNYTPKNVVVENFGIDGLKSAELLELVNSGKLDDKIVSSDFIIISIGGNDIRQIQNLKDIAREESFNQKQEEFLVSLEGITKKIRSMTKDSIVVFIGLYDPYSQLNENARLLTTWNYNAQLIIESDEKALFISTYDLFKFNLDRFIAPDRLHPNGMGYHTISYLVSRSIENILN